MSTDKTFNLRVLKITDSKKSALIKVSIKAGIFTSEVGIGYLYFDQDTNEEDIPEKGFEFPYKGQVAFEPLVDTTSGEVRTTNDGVQLNRLVLK